MATEIKPDSTFKHSVNLEEKKRQNENPHWCDLFPGHEGEPNPTTSCVIVKPSPLRLRDLCTPGPEKHRAQGHPCLVHPGWTNHYWLNFCPPAKGNHSLHQKHQQADFMCRAGFSSGSVLLSIPSSTSIHSAHQNLPNYSLFNISIYVCINKHAETSPLAAIKWLSRMQTVVSITWDSL